MLKYTLIIYIYFIVNILFSQNHTQDSVLVSIAKLPNDSTKVDQIQKSFYKYFFSELDLSDTLFISGIKLSNQLNYKEGLKKMYATKGYLVMLNAEYDKSIDYFNKALNIAIEQNENKSISDYYLNIGAAYSYKGFYELSLQYYLKSMVIKKTITDDDGIGSLYNNISSIYYYQENYKESLKYLKQAINIHKPINDTVNLISEYQNMALNYFALGDTNRMLNYLESSLKYISEKKPILQHILAYYTLGDSYFKLKDYLRAEKFYNLSLTTSKHFIDKDTEALCYCGIGKVALRKRNIPKSLKLIRKCYEMAMESNNFDTQRTSLVDMSDVLLANGKATQSLFFFKKYKALEDSSLSIERTRKIVEIHTLYEVQNYIAREKEKDQKNKLLLKDNKIQTLTIKESQNTIIILMIISFTIVTLLVIIFLYYKKKKVQATNIELQLKQRLLRSQINPHFIFNSLNSIQWYFYKNEKAKGNEFIANFSKLMRSILDGSAKSKISLEDTITTIELYLNVEKQRLRNKFVSEILVEKNINIQTTFIPGLIIQPFIENAIWHGITPLKKQGKITVHFKKENNRIICSVVDNGIGYITSKKVKSRSSRKNESRGIGITTERLRLMSSDKQENVRIIELTDENKNVIGTKATIIIPTNDK